MSINRRQFILSSGNGLMAGLLTTTSLQSLFLREAAAHGTPINDGLGMLSPVKDEATGLPLLKLPRGFRYVTFGWTGDRMTDGTLTPPEPDGMGILTAKGDRILLARNHEIDDVTPSFDASARAYDPQAGGGVTTLLFDTRRGNLVESRIGVSGTARNCSGGITPWGSWLTCEEATDSPGDTSIVDGQSRPSRYTRDHGYVFEVAVNDVKAPKPLTALGRFRHEAVAVHRATGIIYQTEDKETGGFYRFIPSKPGKLAAGGRLQMMKAEGRTDLRRGLSPGERFQVSWVDIAEPERVHSPGTRDGLGVFRQGAEQGGSTFARLEGCSAGAEEIFIAATSGGDVGAGQLFAYRPQAKELRLVYESTSRSVLDSPDSLAVTPSGNILMCENGGRLGQILFALTRQGKLFPIAQNNVVLDGGRNGLRGDFRHEEWSGVTVSPDGHWVFANIQRPGITVAITGPWHNGAV